MALAVINDQRINKMMANKILVRHFPFLKKTGVQAAAAAAPAKRKKGCGKCGRKTRGSQVNYNRIRKYIARLPDEEKAKMKRLLRASQVQVDFVNGKGKKIRLKF